MPRYAEGPSDANIVFIGEAPGSSEEATGRPFVGRSGKLLTKLMAQAGIIRSQCYVTNVVKERPKGNNIKPYINPKKGFVSDKAQKHIDSLWEELDNLEGPNIYVPLGSAATWVLTGQVGVTKWRGSVLEAKDGTKCIPTIHPAAALRMYIYRYFILFDLKRALEQQATPEIPGRDREYILSPSFPEVMEYLGEIRHSNRIAFDIEVSSGEMSCISVAASPKKAISIPFTDATNIRAPYFLPEQEFEIMRHIGYLLEDPAVESVGHNVTFDSTFLFRKYGIKSKNLHDTMIAQGILYPDFPKGLDFVTTQYTLMPYYKDEGKDRMAYGTGEEFWLYNAKDSIVLLEALPKQLNDLKSQGNLETYERQRRLIEPLLFMTELGINVDTESKEKRRDELEKKIEELESELNKLVGYEINPRSPKQLKDYFYDVCGEPPYKHKGKPTTREDALKRLVRKGYREASLVLEIRSYSKMKGTYLEMSLDEDNRIRSSMNPVGTSTGRLSSSKTIFGTGGNMQNLPPEMKRNLICDPGRVMYEIDLSQAENRIVAYLGPDHSMIEAFEKGIDIHSRTASLLFDGPEDKDYQSKQIADLGDGTKPQRFWGKQANHALNYGMGYRKAGFLWEIPEKEAEFIHRRYHQAYPGVKKMQRKIEHQLNKNRTVTNLFGRKRKFFDRWNQIKKDAFAFIPQSTVADIINQWGVREIYEDQEAFADVRLLNQIHDSVVFDLPRDMPPVQQTEILREIQRRLERTLTYEGREFSIPTDVTIFPENLKDGIELGRVTPGAIAEVLDNAVTA